MLKSCCRWLEQSWHVGTQVLTSPCAPEGGELLVWLAKRQNPLIWESHQLLTKGKMRFVKRILLFFPQKAVIFLMETSSLPSQL